MGDTFVSPIRHPTLPNRKTRRCLVGDTFVSPIRHPSLPNRIRHQTGGCVCSAHCRNSMERDAETHCRQSGFTARQAPALCSASCRNKMGRDTKRRNGHIIFSHAHEFGRTEHGGKSVLHCDSGASSMRPRHRGGDVVGDNAHEQLPHR